MRQERCKPLFQIGLGTAVYKLQGESQAGPGERMPKRGTGGNKLGNKGKEEKPDVVSGPRSGCQHGRVSRPRE